MRSEIVEGFNLLLLTAEGDNGVVDYESGEIL